MDENAIHELIHEINGYKVMLDFDLAELYGVTTKALNQAVKRNLDRFCDLKAKNERKALKTNVI